MSASVDGGPPTVPIGERLDGRDPPPDLPCTGETELFFSGVADDIDAAFALCMVCPVRPGCLELALSERGCYNAGSGVWAATTPAMRRAIRRARRASS